MAVTQIPRRAAQHHARLGRELRGLRDRAGLGGIETARRAGMSQAKISRIENCRFIPSLDDVRALCQVYGATGDQRDELLRLVETVREESKRTRVVLPRGAARLQATWERMDSHATLRRTYSPAMVPGILQTADYIRVLFEGEIPDEDIEPAVQGRLRRRKTLTKDATQQHVLVMSEGALRWQIGSPALMVEQIEVVAEVSRLPNVRVGVVPWTTPARFACTHTFDIYDDTAVSVGLEPSAMPFTDPSDVCLYLDMFAQLEQVAVFGEDARRELARVAGEYRLLG